MNIPSNLDPKIRNVFVDIQSELYRIRKSMSNVSETLGQYTYLISKTGTQTEIDTSSILGKVHCLYSPNSSYCLSDNNTDQTYIGSLGGAILRQAGRDIGATGYTSEWWQFGNPAATYYPVIGAPWDAGLGAGNGPGIMVGVSSSAALGAPGSSLAALGRIELLGSINGLLLTELGTDSAGIAFTDGTSLVNGLVAPNFATNLGTPRLWVYSPTSLLYLFSVAADGQVYASTTTTDSTNNIYGLQFNVALTPGADRPGTITASGILGEVAVFGHHDIDALSGSTVTVGVHETTSCTTGHVTGYSSVLQHDTASAAAPAVYAYYNYSNASYMDGSGSVTGWTVYNAGPPALGAGCGNIASVSGMAIGDMTVGGDVRILEAWGIDCDTDSRMMDNRAWWFGFHKDIGIAGDGTVGRLVIKPSAADTDIELYFNGTTKQGSLWWMEDQDYFKFSDAILMQAANAASDSEAIYFWDTNSGIYYEGSTTCLTLVDDVDIRFSSPKVTVQGDFYVGTGAAYGAGTGPAIVFDTLANDGQLTFLEDEDYFTFSKSLFIDSSDVILFHDNESNIGWVSSNLYISDNTLVTINSPYLTPLATDTTDLGYPAIYYKNAYINRIKLGSVAGTTVEGDLWSDSTQKALQTFTDGIEQTLEGVIFTQHDVEVVTAASATTLLDGVGTLTLPANFFVSGKTVRIFAQGFMTLHAADHDGKDLTIRIMLGATVAGTWTITAPATADLTNAHWDSTTFMTCYTAGAPGTVMFQSTFRKGTAAAGTITTFYDIDTSATAITTTGALALDVDAAWSAAIGGTETITCTHATVEVLN